MNSTDIPQIRTWFNSYSASFLTGEELFDANIRIKIEHSYRVFERMTEIADRLELKGRMRNIALTSALLHDCGRFEQFKQYRTYADTRSVNHGKLGVEILEQHDVLSHLRDKTADIIISAVGFHNAKELPSDFTAEQRFFTELTRDADKIDIFSVVLQYYLDENPDKDRTLVHDLPDGEDITPEVFDEFMLDGHVSFSKMKSVVDFKIFQLGWVWDINSKASLRLLLEFGYVEEIISSLPETEMTKAAAAHYRDYMKIIEDEDRLSWNEISRTKLNDCRIFSLYSSQRVSSEGKEATAYMIEAPDWVTVVPLVKKDGKDFFVMVRQYRHG
jgi:putative nucleotidyltransferase with HDIG domain